MDHNFQFVLNSNCVALICTFTARIEKQSTVSLFSERYSGMVALLQVGPHSCFHLLHFITNDKYLAMKVCIQNKTNSFTIIVRFVVYGQFSSAIQ